MKCPVCNKKVEPDWNTCPFCSSPLNEENTDEEVDEMDEDEDSEEDSDEEDIDEEDDIEDEDDVDDEDEDVDDEYDDEAIDDEDDEDIDDEDDEDVDDEYDEEADDEEDEDIDKEDEPDEKPVKKGRSSLVPKKKIVAAKEQNSTYNPNEDHYYDDVVPEIIDELKSHTLENVLKAVGCLAVLILTIAYLIYFT